MNDLNFALDKCGETIHKSTKEIEKNSHRCGFLFTLIFIFI